MHCLTRSTPAACCASVVEDHRAGPSPSVRGTATAAPTGGGNGPAVGLSGEDGGSGRSGAGPPLERLARGRFGRLRRPQAPSSIWSEYESGISARRLGHSGDSIGVASGADQPRWLPRGPRREVECAKEVTAPTGGGVTEEVTHPKGTCDSNPLSPDNHHRMRMHHAPSVTSVLHPEGKSISLRT